MLLTFSVHPKVREKYVKAGLEDQIYETASDSNEIKFTAAAKTPIKREILKIIRLRL
jgi:hypothetical protein